ncbi:MAG TPA: nuclear transport factor 2 family protein [Pyrinomonadaceae bacterium]|nr:nuclear transport factor 2 family protein [Pyrinomonadaceae bacterium]
MRKILIAALLVSLASSFALGQTSTPEPAKPSQSQFKAEILAAGDKLDEAFLKSDPAALALLLADEFISTDGEGLVRDKAETIARLNRPHVKLESLGADEKEMRVSFYGDVAVETGRYTAKGTNRGKPFTEMERYTTVWVKRDARWQIVADHVSPYTE